MSIDSSRAQRIAQARAQVHGWGADLDRANRPAYPMERTPPRLPNGPPGPLAQQSSDVEVLQSTERFGITKVFGTTVPPAGLSGWLRRYAFRYSENDLRHWLALLLADRIHMGEGLVQDVARGHIPNLYAEMGGPAELRHNPAGLARKAAAGVLIVGLVVYAKRQRRSTRLRQATRGER